jgi:translation elongation factor EF-1alpha
MLAKALGVQSMIAVVTKMGTVNWSETRFNHIKSQVGPFLENSCGFPQVTFIPIDSLNNQNIHSKNEGCTWYKSHTLM